MSRIGSASAPKQQPSRWEPAPCGWSTEATARSRRSIRGLARVVDTIPVGRSPEAVAAGARGVWVANADDGTLSGIDPASDEVVKTVGLKNTPQGLAVTPDGVYVAVRSTGREHRGGTLVVLADFGIGSIDPALTQ